MSVLATTFWTAGALLVHTHVTYPLSLALIARLRRRQEPVASPAAVTPPVSLIIAAHDEASVIERRVRNALETEYPRELLEVIVTSDGSSDETVHLAQDAGADLVLDLSRRGKVEAQNAAVDRARGEILAFSDANSFWQPDALRLLVAALADEGVGYVCGQVRFTDEGGQSQEGAYWRYEMWIRGHESALASVTAGNGAIYAVRRAAYARVDPRVSHDLSLPSRLVREGWRAVDVDDARATEKMVPTVEGEWVRKRRMMAHAWPMVVTGGLLDPRGYPPAYAAMILSHRALRYASPFLHVAALAASVARPRRHRVALVAQLGLLAAAAIEAVVRT